MTNDDAGAQSSRTDRRAERIGSALSPAVRIGIAAVLAVLLVGSVVVGAIALDKVAETDARKEARQEAVRAAERFTAQVNNYDTESIDRYEKSIRPMLSTKFRGEFEKAMEDIVTSVKEVEMSSKGNVLASGVASVDQDSARVLVVADADVKTVIDTRKRHFRWQISLVKVSGDWLVDDFTPVA